MTEPEQYSKFNCDICNKEVILRRYPNGTYDRYSAFTDCTAHNPPFNAHLDGFVPMSLYFCDKCGENVRQLIGELKKQGGTLIYFEKNGAPK